MPIGGSQSFELPEAAERYLLTARNLKDTHAELNGSELELGTDDAMPTLAGVPTAPGVLGFPPASITFLAIPKTNNGSCR